jgi:Xaa-Pro aminopeptidase
MDLKKINYGARIDRVCEQLGDGVLLQLATPEGIRNSDVHHNWRQDSFLYWLLGFAEPESALLVVGNAPKGERVHLFLREKNPAMELWTGRRLGVEAAGNSLSVDKAYPISELWDRCADLFGKADKVYYDFGINRKADASFVDVLARHRHKLSKTFHSERMPILDASDLAGSLRLRKDKDEIDRMRHAASITSKAFAEVFHSVRPGMNERQIHGTLLSQFMTHGSEMEAYPSIVAGGANACILHYIENNAELNDGELLLIDAGAQFDYYASDVTRTFPINGKFSVQQKEVYQVVLHAELKAIEKVNTDCTWYDVHNEAVGHVVDGLLDLGLMKESRDEVIDKQLYKKFFPHGTGHWLGMDVHDVGSYRIKGDPVKFEQGMVTTVEPGIYIPPDCTDVPAAYRGIGVRIEDDVLVTDGAPEILTASIPKSIADLEGRM